MPRKVFTAGEVLTAADTNTFLADQVVMTFAGTAARGSAIPTPTEGMVTYLADTNAYEFYDGAVFSKLANPMTTEGDLIVGGTAGVAGRLGIGSAGNVLTSNGTAAAWQPPAGGAGLEWTLLNSGGTSLTGAATITVSSLGGYDNYIVQVVGAKSGAQATFTLTINGSSTNYSIQQLSVSSTSTTSNAAIGSTVNSTTGILLGRQPNNVDGIVNAFAQISGGSTSGSKSVVAHGAGDTQNNSNQIAYSGGGFWNDSDTVASVSIASNAGNFTAGTIYVYGA
jgi:hypothetical protein